MANKKKRVVLQLNEKMARLLADLTDKRGFDYDTETCYWMIGEMHSKEFPAYTQNKRIPISPLEREQARLEARELGEKVKKDQEYKKKAGICEVLGGTIDESSGVPHCRYLKYQEEVGGTLSKVQMVEPFSTLEEDLIHYQYTDLMGNQGPEVSCKLKQKV